MKKFQIFTLVLLSFLAQPFVCSADDETLPKPIILDEKPIKDPTKIKTPSVLQVTAQTDGYAVVVTSDVDVMAHVLIYDAASGQTYYNSAVALAPQCRCAIAPTDALLTLQITIGDIVYEGVFSLR